MIFNSIRWRLQIWYGLILLAVLTGFGLTAYRLERGRQLRRVDEQLRRHAGAIAGALREHRPFRPRLEGMTGNRLPPPGSEFIRDDRPPGDGPPEPNNRPLANFHLPPQQAALFDESETNGFYYVLWQRGGREITRSANAPASVTLPEPRQSGGPEPLRSRGVYRELSLFTPPGEVILTGRSIAGDVAEMRRVAWSLAGVGGAILVFGLAGGWWLASRAIRPIQDISATATKIAGGDLSRRIDITDTENELGRLAGVLNSTFSRLEAAFVQQKQFTADAAHELRTPVSVILTQAQSTLNRERSAGEYRDTIEACQRSAQRMKRLIESLLQLARLDAGQETMKRHSSDLAQVAQDCAEHVRPLADERGVTMRADLSPAPFNGDSDRLAQVVTNLLTNAIHYNRPGGGVNLTTRREGDFVVLSVFDTGIGIPAEDLPHVFERFYRVDKSRSGSQAGAGLGLAICKAIVDAHGGVIETTSQPGTGTRFTIRLPA